MAVRMEVSTTYTKPNCTCYEVYLNNNTFFSALRITPNTLYCLRCTEEIDGETVVSYTSAFVQMPTSMIEEVFPQYDAVLITDVPEGEVIAGVGNPPEVTI